jgi:hypothetical protein
MKSDPVDLTRPTHSFGQVRDPQQVTLAVSARQIGTLESSEVIFSVWLTATVAERLPAAQARETLTIPTSR